MAISYEIYPDLDLIIYICIGVFTAAEFFKIGKMAALDVRLRDGMKIIIDLYSTEMELKPSDLKLAVQNVNQMYAEGRSLGPAAVYTKSSSLKFTAEALRLMSTVVPLQLGIFHNTIDAIRWLCYSEAEKDAIQRWEKMRHKVLNNDFGLEGDWAVGV